MQLDAEAAKKKQKELRDKKNKKEYKKWCALRSRDQYRSKVCPSPLFYYDANVSFPLSFNNALCRLITSPTLCQQP